MYVLSTTIIIIVGFVVRWLIYTFLIVFSHRWKFDNLVTKTVHYIYDDISVSDVSGFSRPLPASQPLPPPVSLTRDEL